MRVALITGGRTAESGGTLGSARALQASMAEISVQADVVELGTSSTAVRETLARVEKYDVVLPLIPGLEAMLEAQGTAYIGSESTVAQLCADKGLLKHVVRDWGHAVGAFCRMRTPVDDDAMGDALNLPAPWFVKPARLGASIGVTSASSPEELKTGLAAALAFDGHALVEAFIGPPVIDLEVAVICTGQDSWITSPTVQISLPPGAAWHSTDTKYTTETHVELAPSSFDDQCQSVAMAIARRLPLRGASRFDFLVSDSSEILFSEVNCLPGHGPASTFPRAFELGGLSRSEQMSLMLNGAQDGPTNLSRF